jgi:endonuclease/exonuclease/phosphatase family metal-dependent hydrolase
LAWLLRSLLAGLLTASVLLYPGVSDSWWVELLRYLPYPAWLGAALLAVLLSLRQGWPWRLASAAALLLVLTVVMGLAASIGDAGSGRLRVMTYNIKSYLANERADAFARIAWEVVQHDPDVIVMQDAGEIDIQRPAVNDTVRAMLRDRTVYTHGQYIVASRLPMRDCRPGDISYRGAGHSYVRCTLVVRGREIDLYTAHLLSPRDGLNAARHERLAGIADWRQNFTERLFQANKLVTDVSLRRAERPTKAPTAAAAKASPPHTGAPRPVILAGDLNAPEASPVVQALLGAGLRDAYSAAGQGYGYTHGHSLRPGLSFLRIDHLLVSAELGVAGCVVGGDQGSEHRPVIADLWVERR